MANHVGLVMSPALAARHGADVLRAPRLGTDAHPQGWAIWAALTGVELPPAPERRFAHLHFAMDAALAGLGVTTLPWPFVADDVQAGRLRAPLGFRATETAFAILAAPGADSRALSRFRDWLVTEGAKTPDPP
jgi:DNA-binding transcriptional LysR family regulator